MSNEELIEKTKQLVTIQSTADNPQGLHDAVNFVAAIIAAHKDITIERFEHEGVPSFLAYYGTERPEQFDILMNGHVDVVPAKDPAQFVPQLKDGRLYGRGVYDMKMASLIMTDLLIRYGKHPTRTIGLQIVADEEIGGKHGVRYQLDQGVTANFVIAGEMTDLGICNETRGICWVEVGFKGASAHGGYAWNGVNAVTKASEFANAVLAKFPIPKQQQWCTTANIAAISTANTTFNIVPDEATVKIDFRFTPEDEHFQTNESVQALIASINPDAHIIDVPLFEPAVHVEETNSYLRHFIRTFESVTNTTPTLIRRYASGDGRHFALRGIPSIEFGLGGANLHAADEYVDMATIEPFRDTLHAFLHSPVPFHPDMSETHATILTTA